MAEIVSALTAAGRDGLVWSDLRKACPALDSDSFALQLRTLQEQGVVQVEEYDGDHFYWVEVEAVSTRHCVTCTCNLYDPDTGAVDIARAKRRVVKMLATHGPMTASALKQRGFGGVHRKRVDPAMSLLADAGRIAQMDDGRWSIAE